MFGSCASIATRIASGWTSEEVALTALELRLLLTLLERRGRVQTRPALLDDVWGISGDVTTRTVDTHVKRLREKLGSAGAYIETVRGVGYRFTPRLITHPPSARPATTTRSREDEAGIRGKLFAGCFGLIILSLLAGEIALRPAIEANLLDNIRGVSRCEAGAGGA